MRAGSMIGRLNGASGSNPHKRETRDPFPNRAVARAPRARNRPDPPTPRAGHARRGFPATPSGTSRLSGVPADANWELNVRKAGSEVDSPSFRIRSQLYSEFQTGTTDSNGIVVQVTTSAGEPPAGVEQFPSGR
jgi:hypothetical protein